MEKKLEWVQQYIKDRGPVDVLNADFVDAYVDEFGAKVKIMLYGANKCPELGRILSVGYKIGVLDRCRIGLTNRYSGFPAWVYVYETKPQGAQQ